MPWDIATNTAAKFSRTGDQRKRRVDDQGYRQYVDGDAPNAAHFQRWFDRHDVTEYRSIAYRDPEDNLQAMECYYRLC